MELVYEGELEGPGKLAVNLIGEATKKVFDQHFPQPRKTRTAAEQLRNDEYEAVTDFFSSGKRLEISDEQPYSDYKKSLFQIPGLKEIATKYYHAGNERETILAMEFVLEGLHQHNVIAKESPDNKFVYVDMLEKMLRD